MLYCPPEIEKLKKMNMQIMSYNPSDYTFASAALTAWADKAAPKGVSSIQIPRKGIIAALKKRGFKIRVRHYRLALKKDENYIYTYLVTRKNAKDFSYISSLGGRTEVDVTFQDGTEVTASAVCSSSDNYCRRLGAYIAFKRAVSLKKEAE